jgi:DnaK suppressor protein
MNDAEIDRYRVLLLQLKVELLVLEETSRESGETVELDQAKIGRLSRMDAMQGQQMALETARRRQLQLKKIEGALQRIESNDFGDCFVCGEAIDTRRLNIDPTLSRCMDCAEKSS